MKTTRTDSWGVWKGAKGKHCYIEVLTEPSDAFRQYQAAQPEPLPERNMIAELDELRAEIEILKKKEV